MDEVEALLSRDHSVLYKLFELSYHPSSSLTLICIMNAVDVTHRLLPRVKALTCKDGKRVVYFGVGHPDLSQLASVMPPAALVPCST